jgi:hypothetical protein
MLGRERAGIGRAKAASTTHTTSASSPATRMYTAHGPIKSNEKRRSSSLSDRR